MSPDARAWLASASPSLPSLPCRGPQSCQALGSTPRPRAASGSGWAAARAEQSKDTSRPRIRGAGDDDPQVGGLRGR